MINTEAGITFEEFVELYRNLKRHVDCTHEQAWSILQKK